MAEPENQSAAKLPRKRVPDAGEIIFNSASDAIGSAFFLWILGGVALSIAGGFASGMIPTLPPGFAARQALEDDPGSHHFLWWHAIRRNGFWFFFAVFFAHSLWVGFRGGAVGKRWERVLSKLRENWFGLIVGNAIGAWIATLILGLVPEFSWAQIFWQWAWNLFLPMARELGRLIFGESGSASLSDWFSWYGANHTKLIFWIIYFGGMFDDLGVPNFKTLGRWGWRRMKNRGRAAPVGSVALVELPRETE